MSGRFALIFGKYTDTKANKLVEIFPKIKMRSFSFVPLSLHFFFGVVVVGWRSLIFFSFFFFFFFFFF